MSFSPPPPAAVAVPVVVVVAAGAGAGAGGVVVAALAVVVVVLAERFCFVDMMDDQWQMMMAAFARRVHWSRRAASAVNADVGWAWVRSGVGWGFAWTAAARAHVCGLDQGVFYIVNLYRIPLGLDRQSAAGHKLAMHANAMTPHRVRLVPR
jgi:hypothetical protein